MIIHASRRLERQAKQRAQGEQADYERKVKAREQRKGRRKGNRIKAPNDQPEDREQSNLTDPDSRLMRKNKRSEYRQGYNAQAVVDADGTQLVLGHRVSQCASDRGELESDVVTIPESVGCPETVLADSGYASEDEVKAVEQRDIEVLIATGPTVTGRRYDFRPPRAPKPPPKTTKPWITAMQEKMSGERERELYRRRKHTVEPVFGIVKHAMGFRQFLLRGLGKVETEWCLLMLAYNCKRLHRLMGA